MPKEIKDKLMDSVQEAKNLYHNLVLLVGLPGSNKTMVLAEVAEELGQKPINVNLELSRRLLEMTNKKRVLKVTEKLDEILAPCPKYAILDPTEILFDVSLKQDPLALLKRISRNRTIIASWNGTIDNGKLIYSEIGHSEHRTYNPTDIQVVSMDKAH